MWGLEWNCLLEQNIWSWVSPKKCHSEFKYVFPWSCGCLAHGEVGECQNRMLLRMGLGRPSTSWVWDLTANYHSSHITKVHGVCPRRMGCFIIPASIIPLTLDLSSAKIFMTWIKWKKTFLQVQSKTKWKQYRPHKDYLWTFQIDSQIGPKKEALWAKKSL